MKKTGYWADSSRRRRIKNTLYATYFVSTFALSLIFWANVLNAVNTWALTTGTKAVRKLFDGPWLLSKWEWLKEDFLHGS